MVKLLFSPTSSAWRRSSFTQTAWNVPSHGMPSTVSPSRLPTRFFISRAALLVKVTASISFGLACPVFSRCAIRVVRARVLPVPAPASIRTGPSIVSTASRCAGFRPSRYSVGRAAIAIADREGLAACSNASNSSDWLMRYDIAFLVTEEKTCSTIVLFLFLKQFGQNPACVSPAKFPDLGGSNYKGISGC